jgi:hypothetical protein
LYVVFDVDEEEDEEEDDGGGVVGCVGCGV